MAMDQALARIARIEWWARAGYAARGLVYVLLGTLILMSGRGVSTASAVAAVRLLPAGTLILVALGLGMFGYGLFRLYEALLDLEGRGDGWGGRFGRIGRALGGLAYWALALVAARTLWGGAERGAAERATQEAGRQVAASPGGSTTLLLAGIVILGIAVAQARRAWRCDFWPLVEADAPRIVRHLGRAGFAARAIVIALVGWFVVRAATGGTPVRGIGGALDSLRTHQTIMNGVAVGLILFGVFSLALARYRRIRDDDAIARLKARFA